MSENEKKEVSDFRLWSDFCASPSLMIEQKPMIGPRTKFFAMGSCFAMEIRRALTRQKFDVYPHYTDVKFDRSVQIFDKMPEREDTPHHDTFVIRQEFETAFGVFESRAEGAWSVTSAMVNKVLGRDEVFQDPYRKMAYGATRDHLGALIEGTNRVVREGIEAADVFIITLGLTEVWQHNQTGRYICRPPNTGLGGGKGEATFRLSTFADNYANMKTLFDMFFKHYPDRQVILTVSPVPLAMTYSNADVGTANLESKSILRAVAGQITREYENVAYFPSYEMATIIPWPVFQEDKRHVLPEFADRVVRTFMQCFGKR